MTDSDGFDFSSIFSDQVLAELRESFRATLGGLPMPAGLPDELVTPSTEILLDKKACYMEVPAELLMDAGIIPDTRTHKPPSRRDRIRWSIAAAREYIARWAYRRIAGYDVPESDY